MPSVWRRRLQGTGRDWCELVASSRPWQDGLTGSAWGDWANYTASPLRAFENELGVQAGPGQTVLRALGSEMCFVEIFHVSLAADAVQQVCF